MNLDNQWPKFCKAVEDKPPRQTLLTALARFEAEPIPAARFAVDLGCGDGRDTVELLRRGWHVLGIDAQKEAITRLLSRPDLHSHLETRIERFERLNLPQCVDLINASFCLQFCPPADFPTLWQKIVAALRFRGRFCGQLIGERDSWAAYPRLSHHTRSQVEELLQAFDIEVFEEEEHFGKTALKAEKHWHLFHIVACKKED